MNKEIFITTPDENTIKQFGEELRAFMLWFEQWCDEVQQAIMSVIENLSVDISPKVNRLFEELSDLAESAECDDEHQNQKSDYFICNFSKSKTRSCKSRYYFIKARGPPEVLRA